MFEKCVWHFWHKFKALFFSLSLLLGVYNFFWENYFMRYLIKQQFNMSSKKGTKMDRLEKHCLRSNSKHDIWHIEYKTHCIEFSLQDLQE